MPQPLALEDSYDDLLRTVPERATSITFALFPFMTGGWDGFICRSVPDEHENYFIAIATVGGLCGELGCGSYATIPAQPFRGQSLVFRAYNWLDAPSCPGRITLA